MSEENQKRQVPIANARTGETRLSEPMPVHGRRDDERDAFAAESAAVDDAIMAGQSLSPLPVKEGGPPHSNDDAVRESIVPESTVNMNMLPDAAAASGDPDVGNNVPAADASVRSGSKTGKPKEDIKTLEQFIGYAYSRKGQRVVLKTKTEQLIAQDPRLDEMALSRLTALAAADTALAVPRQLLLAAKDIDGRPALQAAIRAFVRDVMLRSPVFGGGGAQGAILNQPEAPPASQVLAGVMRYVPPATDQNKSPKLGELQEMRLNAVHLLATWMVLNRGLDFEALTNLLLQTVWQPATMDLADDTARLRALTELSHPAGVGLACERFRQRMVEALAAQEHAQRESNTLRDAASSLELSLQTANAKVQSLETTLAEVRQRSEEELASLRQSKEQERTQLAHELDQLRGRLTRRLSESIDMLAVGLSALQKQPPRVEVMTERAEHVIDSLHREQAHLKGE